jgi:Fe-S-cluster-containing dehydrogenase component
MRLEVIDADRCVGCQSCVFDCAGRQGEAGLAETCAGVRSVEGMERAFVVIVCIACDVPLCARTS